MSMNTLVSYPIAKMLKEKGFDLATRHYYECALKSQKHKHDGYSGPFGWKKGELNLQTGYFLNNNATDFTSEGMWYSCSAPTIAEVVMWLYEKHGIWVSVVVIPFEKHFMFEYSISNVKECLNQDGVFNSPTEAYEIAIEYTLNKLI